MMHRRGFTIVELLVVLGIIAMLMTIVITSQAQFNRGLTINDIAYTVALTLRQSQTFGLSSRTFSNITNAAYGVHFGPANASTPLKSYQLFADVYPVAPGTSSTYCPGHTGASGSPDAKPGNCTYDSTQSEMVQNYVMSGAFNITNVCGHDTVANGGGQRCTGTGYLTGVDVLYLRPNTDSIVVGLKSGGNIPLTDAQITLTASQGGTRYICVTSVGEISVATTTCP